MHQSPEIFHKFETLTNHFVELVVPWFLIGPRRLCMIGGAIQILFQVRCWNRGYGQFSVIWHAWYFVQLEWHLHNISVLYLSFLHERIIKISFDIVKMIKDAVWLLYILFQITIKPKKCLVSQTLLCNNKKGNNSKYLKWIYYHFCFEFAFYWEDLKERIDVIENHQCFRKQHGFSRWWLFFL